MLNKRDFIICVDMDDTIEDLCPAWIDWLNNKYNLNVKLEDITAWKIESFFPTLTREQIFEPIYNSNFWYTIKPKSDAQYYLKKLCDDGFSVYLCTAAHYATCGPKMDAIVKRYFNFIDWKHIITCSNKQMIKCDILIDDGLHNLIGGDYIPILMSTPHNMNFDDKKNNVDRVSSWKEIYKKVYNYYNKKKNI